MQTEINISELDISFLQAYLMGIFSGGAKCTGHFEHTDWYLNNKYHNNGNNEMKSYLVGEGATCDCAVLKNIESNFSQSFLNRIPRH
ncbi:MAG: hypothetical protein KJ799_18275 [Bacteroidetes bacterium]|nr:hypothetical protein [Bacteroidota bacterium]MBU1679168.1 hypothetical protein [Bacteroidota bacterium]MBU2508644.1 hypothetical protein [Bacteroidota bacterium]